MMDGWKSLNIKSCMNKLVQVVTTIKHLAERWAKTILQILQAFIWKTWKNSTPRAVLVSMEG